jgi:hypothetical protein
MAEEIDEQELPQEGNSNARLYPPAGKDDGGNREEDPQQANQGDAAAVRDEGPSPSDAE